MPPSLNAKIVSASRLVALVRRLQRRGRRIVFTNGCFDLLHAGHVQALEEARGLGDALIVALNTDRSVRALGKGRGRPFMPLADRLRVMAALGCVDYVTSFDEPTPYRMIAAVQPDVLAKGGDWRPGRIVGADVVAARGGRVVRLRYRHGRSTTALIRKIQSGR